MKKSIISLSLAWLSLTANAYACDNCLTKQQLITMSPQQIVAEMQRLSAMDISLNNASIGWDATIPGWEGAYTAEKVAAVSNLLKQTYVSGGNADLLRSMLPAKYLASMNYTYHVHVKKGGTVASDEFTANHLAMINGINNTVANILDQEAALVNSFDQTDNSYITMYDLLRLVETPDNRPGINNNSMLGAAFKYGKALASETFTKPDGQLRLTQLSVLANSIKLHTTAGNFTKLSNLPTYDSDVAAVGEVVNKYHNDLTSTAKFFSPRSSLNYTSDILSAVSWSISNTTNLPVYDTFLKSIPNLSSTHVYLASVFQSQSVKDCKVVTQLDLCSDTLVPKMKGANVANSSRDGISIVGNIPAVYANHLFDQMHVVKSAYSKTFGPLEPVPGDINTNLRVVLYTDKLQYQAYQHLVNGLPSNNGGIYIEKDNTLYTFIHNEDSWDGQYYFHTEELIRHEYVHWLNGRYLIPGGYNESPMYKDGQLVAIEEGLANYFAGATATGPVKPVSTMVNWFSWSPSQFNLSDDLSVDYNDANVYEYSAMALAYQASIGKLSELKTILRTENESALQSWKRGDTIDYRRFVDGLIAGNRNVRWDTPFTANGLHLNSAVEFDKVDEIKNTLVQAGTTSVDCATINDTRYACTLTYGGDIDNVLVPLSSKYLTFKYTSCETLGNNNFKCVGPIRKSGTSLLLQPYQVSTVKPTEVKPGESFTIKMSINVNDSYHNFYSIVDVVNRTPSVPVDIVYNTNGTVDVKSTVAWSGLTATTLSIEYVVIDSTGRISKKTYTDTLSLLEKPPVTTTPTQPASPSKSGGSLYWWTLLLLMVRRTRG